VSEIHGAEVIERGYGNLVEKLRSLGAEIEVV
jgi:UDP-N-acetylglucosamine enolpyruvyl transferase